MPSFLSQRLHTRIAASYQTMCQITKDPSVNQLVCHQQHIASIQIQAPLIVT